LINRLENCNDMKLRDIIAFIIWVIIMTFIYIVLREDVSYATLLTGFGLGVSSLVICLLFFKKTFIMRYYVKFIPFVWYIVNLVIMIIVSGVKALILGLFSQTTSTLITYKSRLKNDMLITLLANSITLTPGTVTIDKADNTLKFMRLCEKDCPSKINDVKRLEKLLSYMDGEEK